MNEADTHPCDNFSRFYSVFKHLFETHDEVTNLICKISESTIPGICFMVKLIVMVKRKKGMSQDEFNRYWREIHGPLVRNSVPGLIKYIQNHHIDAKSEKSHYDGVAELYFKDMDAYHHQNEWYISKKGEIIRNDIPNFLDPEMASFLCEEELIE